MDTTSSKPIGRSYQACKLSTCDTTASADWPVGSDSPDRVAGTVTFCAAAAGSQVASDSMEAAPDRPSGWLGEECFDVGVRKARGAEDLIGIHSLLQRSEYVDPSSTWTTHADVVTVDAAFSDRPESPSQTDR